MKKHSEAFEVAFSSRLKELEGDGLAAARKVCVGRKGPATPCFGLVLAELSKIE